MKRLVYVMMALVVLFAANSCKDKKTVPVISTNDSVALEDAENDSTIYGVCGEGTSMHSLELISDAGDTLTVFIDDEQPQIFELHVLGKQPMRADDDIDFAVLQPAQRFLLLLG